MNPNRPSISALLAATLSLFVAIQAQAQVNFHPLIVEVEEADGEIGILGGNKSHTQAHAPVKYPYAGHKTLHIDGAWLGKCFAAEALYQSPPANRIDANQVILKKIKLDYRQSGRVNDLQSYLQGSPNRGYDWTSGHEDELYQWVQSQANNSIDPMKIYAASLRLNNGNIWNAILTIHQLIRNNARWYNKKRYDYVSNTQKAQAFFSKFIDIRGDLQERGDGSLGDHEGSWYRIWGALLEQLAIASAADRSGIFGGIVYGAGTWLNQTMFYSDEVILKGLGRSALGRKPDPDAIRKLEIDQAGATIGDSLVSTLKIKDAANLKNILNRCYRREYLRP